MSAREGLAEVLGLANQAAIYQLVLETCTSEASSDQYREAQGRFYAAEFDAHRAALAYCRTHGAELLAEVEGLRRDAERYRWLAANCYWNAYNKRPTPYCVIEFYVEGGKIIAGQYDGVGSSTLATAMDAALAKAPA